MICPFLHNLGADSSVYISGTLYRRHNCGPDGLLHS
jgi:hypothetical protein